MLSQNIDHLGGLSLDDLEKGSFPQMCCFSFLDIEAVGPKEQTLGFESTGFREILVLCFL